MDSKTKFRHKKLAKRYFIISNTFVVLVFLSFISMFATLFPDEVPGKIVFYIIFFCIFLFTITGLIISFKANTHAYELKRYKYQIEKWRKQNFSNKILFKGLELIDSGNIQSAIDLFLQNHLKMLDDQEYMFYCACMFKGMYSEDPLIVKRVQRAYDRGIEKFIEDEQKMRQFN